MRRRESPHLRLDSLALLLLLDLQQQRAVDVGQDTSERDGGTDEGVELLVTTDGELEMAGSDALDLEILGRVLCVLHEVSLLPEARDTGGGRWKLTPASSRTSAVRYSRTAVT